VSTVSAFVPAYQSADRLPLLIHALRAFADEVVVAVDDRSIDGTAEVAAALADRVTFFTHDETFARIFEEMFRCRSDWIVRFDDDETPSAGWTRARVAELAADDAISHYYFARRWIVPPGDRYICVPPHWPNFAMRMVRNRRAGIERIGDVHARFEVHGTPSYVHGLFIDHWNLTIFDRRAREDKVAEYERGAAGMGHPQWYLYEDFGYQTDVLHEPPRGRGPAGEAGSPSPYCVDVRIIDLPAPVVAGTTYTADVELVNRSARPIAAVEPAHAEQPNRFSSHWVQAAGPKQYFEGPRTPIATPIAPGATRRALIRIDAPPQPGAYWLQADVVEELVAWYSAAPGAGFHEPRYVEVVAPADPTAPG
jgi:Glycosyl transferase family 2